jgi:hypothetical protein
VSGERLVFPVGQCGGRVAADDPTPARYRVRVGERVFALTKSRFMGWVAGHGSHSLPDGAKWTVAAATESLAAMGVPDAGNVLNDLRSDGLLADVGPTDEVDFARRHRLAPLLLGLGNSPRSPGGYSIGLPDRPVVDLPRPLNTVWEWSDTAPDLWSMCRRFAEAEREYEGHDPRLADPPRVLHDLLRDLHRLLRVNAAYLDLAGTHGGTSA